MFDHETRISDLESSLSKLEKEIKYCFGLFEFDESHYPTIEVKVNVLNEIKKLCDVIGIVRKVQSKDREITYTRERPL